MSDDHQESLDLFDDHEEVVSEDGKKVTRRFGLRLGDTIKIGKTILTISSKKSKK